MSPSLLTAKGNIAFAFAGSQALQLLITSMRFARHLALAARVTRPDSWRRPSPRGVLPKRAVSLAACLAALALASACVGDPTSSRSPGNRTIRLGVAPSVTAAPGAVLEGTVAFASRNGIVTLARDSVVIPSTPNASDLSLSLAANVSACVDEAEAVGSSCSLVLTLRLTRAGAVLDESVQQLPVDRNTQVVTVEPITLLEVATVTVTPATLTAFEPGDTQLLTAVARDRNGATVLDRNAVWAVVTGGVSISNTGLLTAVSPGQARVRVTIGGRTSEIVFTVGQPTVANIAVAPFDTLIPVGGTATLRTTVTATNGQTLTGRPLTYSSSNPSVATVSATGVVTGVSVGTTNIQVRSTEGRGGATVTGTVPLRVELAPQILIQPTVFLDSLVPGATGTALSIPVTATAGRRVSGLRAVTTYVQSVSPWLLAIIDPDVTPALLTVQVNSGNLAPGLYEADVTLSSTTQPHRPGTIRVSFRVVPARRVALSPKIVDLGTYSSSVTSAPATSVSVTSPTGIPLTGLAATIQYTSTRTGWLSAVLTSPTTPPASSLQLTPNPFGLPDGTYTARVIVSSTTFMASPDTVNVTLTVLAASGRFAGQLLSAGNPTPIANATVTVRRASDNVVVSVVSTASDGQFLTASLPAGTYTLTFTAPGFISTTYFSAILSGVVSVPQTTLPTTLLAPTGSPAGAVNGQVRDATNNNAIAGVTIELRNGANNTGGAALATTITDSDGAYFFAAQPAGTYTILASLAGYATSTVTTTIVSTQNNAPLIFISPGGANLTWRFVLSWGSLPLDLDAHLTGPLPSSSNRFHVYFGSRGSATVSPFSVLDIDQQDGIGPETITIAQQTPGIYRYFVDNYSQEIALSASNARVDVYLGNSLVNQFFVPSQPGLIWNVFEINGTTLTPVNTIGNTPPAILASPAPKKSLIKR